MRIVAFLTAFANLTRTLGGQVEDGLHVLHILVGEAFGLAASAVPKYIEQLHHVICIA